MLFSFYFVNMHPYFTKSMGFYMHESIQFEKELIEIQEHCQHNSELTPYVILMDLMEGRVYDSESINVIAKLREALNKHNIQGIFVLDRDFLYLSSIPESDDVIYSNFYLLSSCFQTHHSETQKVNKRWNNASELGLWLPGNLARHNRIHLIEHLWKRNLLGTIKYSCQITSSEEQRLKEDFLKYDNVTFDKFKKECTNVLDWNCLGNEKFESTGYPFDVTLYEDTSFSIITESDFAWGIDGKTHWLPKVTEKTYRSIANKHPFIVCWYPGMIQRMEELGFKSFKEYLPFPNYNQIEDLHERINCTVENIRSFPQVKDFYKSEIECDIEHNYQLFLDMYEVEKDRIQRVLDLPQCTDPVYFKTLKNFVHFMSPIPSNPV